MNLSTESLYPLGYIMEKAWGYARVGQETYGGSVSEWLPAALKRAWSEIKSDPVAAEVRKIRLEMRARAAAGHRPPVMTKRESSRGRSYMGI